MVEISLLLPTRERPALVQRMLGSVLETAVHPSLLEVILYIDEDDAQSMPIEFSGLKIIKLIGPRKSMGEMTQACYERSTGRLIILVNDDLVFRTKGWDLLVREAADRYLDGILLLYSNDGYYGKKLSTFPILPRRCCDLLGQIAPFAYQNHCIDSHLFNIFEQLAELGHPRLVYLRKVLFEHMQYGSGKGDEKDRMTYHSLAEERERVAHRLSQYIESPKNSALSSASLLIYNPESVPLTFISALLEEDRKKHFICDITVVSPDPEKISERIPRRFRKRVKIYGTEGEGSMALQLNEAASQAGGNYLIFLNGSSVPEKEWLELLIRGMHENETGVLGSLWLNPRNGRVEQAGFAFVQNQQEVRMSYLYRGLPADHPVVNRSRQLEAVGFSGMIVRKEAFQEAGGFSEQYPGAESIDLCLRLREKGYSIQVELRARMKYMEPWRIEEAQLCYNWRGRVVPDLLDILKEDQFTCHAL